MINLDKYKLKQKYRKVLDNLSDDDKIKKCFSKNYSIEEIRDIITWYELENNVLLKILILEKFGKDPQSAYCYAFCVIKGRWVEAEEFIKQDPVWAYYYACEIIKGRWIEAEEIIKQDPGCAYHYAYYVIKGRWIEAEEFIKQDVFWWNYYQKFLRTIY